MTRPSRTNLKARDQTIRPLTTQEVAAITTAIHIPKETWELLRAVAFRRAQQTGGRASVSKLIVELVERCRFDLQKELSIDDSSIDKPLIKR